MTEFIILYYAPKTAHLQCKNMSSEEQASTMKAWARWAELCGNNLLDEGTPFESCTHLDTSGIRETSSEVVGYSIMQADNVSKVKELLKANPTLGMDGFYIEIHEKIPLPK